jgi:hypothetical protein
VSHRRFHPAPVDDCFGCKVASIGYDGGTTSRANRITGTPESLPATVTEHRDGRQDVTVHAPAIRMRTSVHEERQP